MFSPRSCRVATLAVVLKRSSRDYDDREEEMKNCLLLTAVVTQKAKPQTETTVTIPDIYGNSKQSLRFCSILSWY